MGECFFIVTDQVSNDIKHISANQQEYNLFVEKPRGIGQQFCSFHHIKASHKLPI